LDGDEFIVLVEGIRRPTEAGQIARKLLSAAIKPIEIMGQECRVTASIGIAMYPGDGEDARALMKKSDLAMYCAKEEGKNNFQFYTKGAGSLSIERLSLETKLRSALERSEFSLQRSEEHTSELQSRENLVCRLLLEKKNNRRKKLTSVC